MWNEPLPGTEPEKQTLKPRKGVVVFQSPSSSSLEGKATQVFVPSNTDGSQTIVIGSASFYDWMDDVKKTLAKEKRENMNDACLKLLNMGQTEPEALDIEYKIDNACASVPEGEASHTDPSPLDEVDSWVLCKERQSGPGASGPGGDTGGGGGGDPGSGPGDPGIGPGGEPDGGDDSGSGSATVDSLVEILCTPAVGAQPGVDPRLVYPAPDQVEAVVANLAPCVDDFCPFEIIFEVPELTDPTDPIDPSEDDTEELDETHKDQLMCSKFRGFCEPDITLISKNDLAKGDEEDFPPAKDGDCDGKENGKPGETCKDPNVGEKDEEWSFCAESVASNATVCVDHDPKSNDQYTVRYINHEGSGHHNANPSDREHEALGLVEQHHYGEDDTCTVMQTGLTSTGAATGFQIRCN